jgi:HK97 family phage major capsid protein
MERLTALRQRRTALAAQLPDLADNAAEFDRVEREVQTLDQQIARAQRAIDVARGQARPLDMPVEEVANEALPPNLLRFGNTSRMERAAWTQREFVAHARAAMNFTPANDKHFETFGTFLRAVIQHYMKDGTDNRLQRAPLGAGESDASAGGFLVQTDFANAVWTRAYTMGDILGGVMKLPISTNANSIKLPAIDESSRVTGSRWGGVRSYWLAEGDQPNSSRPAFRLIELDLKKLFSTMYVSDELLQDTNLIAEIAMQAFSEEIMFMTEDAIFEGDGVGKPLGVLNAPCLVTVPKDNGQASATLSLNNIITMWSRMWIRSRKNAAWYINQDVEPQLYQLSQAVGTGGLPMFLPAGGLNAAPYSTLFGRPVIPIEYAATLGTPGDILLGDFSQYVLAEKRGMQAATSMHVRFLTDEMTLRFTYRVDGKPLWHTPLTPFKGANTKSPFVVLAQR